MGFLKQINTKSMTNLSVRAQGLPRVNCLSKSIPNPSQICPSELRAPQGQLLKQINTKSITTLSDRAQGSPGQSSGLPRVNFLSKSIPNPSQICPSEPRALESELLKQINTKPITN